MLRCPQKGCPVTRTEDTTQQRFCHIHGERLLAFPSQCPNGHGRNGDLAYCSRCGAKYDDAVPEAK